MTRDGATTGRHVLLWGLLINLICSPALVFGDPTPIYDVPPSGILWVDAGAEIDLYASGSYTVYINTGSIVNFQSGASATQVVFYGAGDLNMYGGSIGGTTSVHPGEDVTIYGTYSSMTTTAGAGHYDAAGTQIVVDDGTNGWNGTVTFTYEGDRSEETLAFSAYTNIHFATSGTTNTPPNANAGADVSIFTSEQAAPTVLEGTAGDADGDEMTYRWLEGETELKGSTAVPIDGVVTLDLSTIPQIYLPGVLSDVRTLKLEVCDGTDTVTDLMDLSVFNTPPSVAPASTSLVVSPGDPISIDATVADFDGDSVSYEWRENGTGLVSGSASPPAGGDPVSVTALTGTAGTAPFELGVNQLVVAVSDGVNASETSVSVTVEVIDTEAPTLAPEASTTMLWPPNHRMRPVTIQANAVDDSGGPVTLEVEVTSNEPDPDDWIVDSVDSVTGIIELQLRAERSGSGDGRIYTVTITATDEAGNASVATVEVCVPHDRRKNR